MQGLMMTMPLMISSLIRHADRWHGDTEIVSRTIEGPISDVSALLDNHPLQPSESSGNASASRAPAGGSPVGSALTFRHGDRMFAVTGSLPSDSLRAMMRRLNLMSRVR